MRSSQGIWEVRFVEDEGSASSREAGRKEEREGGMEGDRHACRHVSRQTCRQKHLRRRRRSVSGRGGSRETAVKESNSIE